MKKWAWVGGGLIAAVAVIIVVTRVASACLGEELSPLADLNVEVVEGARWGETIDELNDLGREWTQLKNQGSTPRIQERLAEISREREAIADAMVARLERLQDHPGTDESVGEFFLDNAIIYWRAVAVLEEWYYLQAVEGDSTQIRSEIEKAEEREVATYQDFLYAQCRLATVAGIDELRQALCY